MKYDEFVASKIKSGEVLLSGMSPGGMDMLHMAVGLSGEAGELLEAYHLFDSGIITELFENVKEEMGDLEFYSAGLVMLLPERFFSGETLAVYPEWYITWGHQQNKATIAKSMFELMRDSAIAIAISASRILDLVKKQVVYNKATTDAEIVSELQVLHDGLRVIRMVMGASRESILQGNMDKLNKRYPAGYSDKAAQERVDKLTEAEAKAEAQTKVEIKTANRTIQPKDLLK